MQSPSVSIEKSLALDAILGETGYDPESGIKSRNRSYGRAEALRSTKERFSIFPNMASKRAESINSQTSTESYVKKNYTETVTQYDDEKKLADARNAVELQKISELREQLDWYKWQEKAKNPTSDNAVKNLFDDLLRAFNQGNGIGLLVTFMELMMANPVKTERGYTVDEKLFEALSDTVSKTRLAMDTMESISKLQKSQPNISRYTLTEYHAFIQKQIDKCRPFEKITSNRMLFSDAPKNFNAYVEFDDEIMGKAVTEILLNAMKFSVKDAPVKIIMRPEGNFVELNVLNDPLTDSGGNRGIPLGLESLVFEPFYRLNKNTYEDYGTLDYGLGLTYVAAAMKRHGGGSEITNIRDHSNFVKGAGKNVMSTLKLNAYAC